VPGNDISLTRFPGAGCHGGPGFNFYPRPALHLFALSLCEAIGMELAALPNFTLLEQSGYSAQTTASANTSRTTYTDIDLLVTRSNPS
jgi:hypothetical protein